MNSYNRGFIAVFLLAVLAFGICAAAQQQQYKTIKEVAVTKDMMDSDKNPVTEDLRDFEVKDLKLQVINGQLNDLYKQWLALDQVKQLNDQAQKIAGDRNSLVEKICKAAGVDSKKCQIDADNKKVKEVEPEAATPKP